MLLSTGPCELNDFEKATARFVDSVPCVIHSGTGGDGAICAHAAEVPSQSIAKIQIQCRNFIQGADETLPGECTRRILWSWHGNVAFEIASSSICWTMHVCRAFSGRVRKLLILPSGPLVDFSANM